MADPAPKDMDTEGVGETEAAGADDADVVGVHGEAVGATDVDTDDDGLALPDVLALALGLGLTASHFPYPCWHPLSGLQ